MKVLDAEEGLVLFVDVAGSTQLYEELGDIAAYTKISTCLAQLGDIVARFGGVVVKHIGDEVLCFFVDTVAGLRAAIVAQIEMSTASGNAGLPVRIGCHYGPILVRNDDLYGDTVNIAAHLAGLAQAKQVLTSQQTLDKYEADRRQHVPSYNLHEFLDFSQSLQSRELTRFKPKGKQFHVDVAAIQWELFLEDMIADWTFVQPIPIAEEPSLAFHIQGDGYVYTLDASQEQLTLGRTENADVLVNSRNVSRQHGEFAWASGQVRYEDKSSNGTYIRRDASQDVIFLHRDSTHLQGQGVLSFGVALDDETCVPFRFWFK